MYTHAPTTWMFLATRKIPNSPIIFVMISTFSQYKEFLREVSAPDNLLDAKSPRPPGRDQKKFLGLVFDLIRRVKRVFSSSVHPMFCSVLSPAIMHQKSFRGFLISVCHYDAWLLAVWIVYLIKD